jgi:hypothetical protein
MEKIKVQVMCTEESQRNQSEEDDDRTREVRMKNQCGNCETGEEKTHDPHSTHRKEQDKKVSEVMMR